LRLVAESTLHDYETNGEIIEELTVCKLSEIILVDTTLTL
jgi:hypothetical protein